MSMGPYHPSPDESFEAVARAAFAGDAQAQFKMGEILRRGLFSQAVDEGMAHRWYERAAVQGQREAVFLLNNWRQRHHFR